MGLIPLLEEGVAAAREYIAIGAFGAWDPRRANMELTGAAELAGREPFTTYQIRHSFASGLRQSGDVADIQDLYGHTNSETTKIYAAGRDEKHRDAIRNMRAADGRAANQNPSQ